MSKRWVLAALILIMAGLVGIAISCVPAMKQNTAAVATETDEGGEQVEIPEEAELIDQIPEDDEEEREDKAPAYASYSDPFDPYDWTLRGLDEHSAVSDAIAAFGQPVSQQDDREDGKYTTALEYPWGSLSFAGDKKTETLLCGGKYTDGTYSGPRDIKVGDELQTLIDAFPSDFQKNEADRSIMYCANSASYSGDPEPPYGILELDGDSPDKYVVAARVSLNTESDGQPRLLYLCEFDIEDGVVKEIEYKLLDETAPAVSD